MSLVPEIDMDAPMGGTPEVTFADVVDRLEALEYRQQQILEVMQAIREKIEPTLEAISNSPVGKMFGM